MAIAKIQTGDKVKVIAGSYKGTEGVVTKVVTKKQGKKPSIVRAAISSVPAIIKYRKANRQFNLPGEKLTTDRLINVSNLSLVDDKGSVSKIKIELDSKTNKKQRVFKSTSKTVSKTPIEEKTTKKDPKDKKETKETAKSTDKK
jgi:ribosomal protein L24